MVGSAARANGIIASRHGRCSLVCGAVNPVHSVKEEKRESTIVASWVAFCSGE